MYHPCFCELKRDSVLTLFFNSFSELIGKFSRFNLIIIGSSYQKPKTRLYPSRKNSRGKYIFPSFDFKNWDFIEV